MTMLIDILMCTFRRPMVGEAIEAIGQVKLPPDVEMRLVIADNDDTDSAREVVARAAASLPFPCHYIHAPARNISLARNACLDAATQRGADWILSLDDDETVQPDWLIELMEAVIRGDADGGFGTVQAIYPQDAPAWVSAVLGQWLRIPEFGTVDLDPVNRFQEPALRLDLRGRSGPIMVMIDYEIDQKDVPEFLRLMALRRNIRRRDGARNWALLRDLESPERWTESYHIATWDEYVRHNLRRTKADYETYRELHALHRGEHPPAVHRMIERHAVSQSDDLPLLGKLELP